MSNARSRPILTHAFRLWAIHFPTFVWLVVQSVHALHCFCDVLENMFLCSLPPRYISRNTTKRDHVGQLQRCTSYTTVISTTCKASYIAFFVVKHNLLTIDAYKLALTLQQKINCTISQMCCTSWTKCTATTTTPSWGRRYYRKIRAKWSYLFSYWPQQNVKALTPLLSTYLKKHLSRARDLCVAIWAYSQLC
jgi:hypothetical protein